MKALVQSEARRVWASPAYRVLAVLLLAVTAVSLGYGRAVIAHQERVLDQLASWTRQGDNLYFETRFEDDEKLGRAAYYFRQPTEHRSAPLASLTLGQRDLHPYFLSIRIRGLYSQLFDSDLGNPLKSMAGHFDLAFVVVFLFPLALIGCSFNILSQERERQTLALIRATPTPLGAVLLARLAVRVGFLLTLSGLAVIASHGFSTHGLVWIAASWLYLLFWAGLIAWIVGWAFDSTLSALLLVAIWLSMTVLGPAGLNLLQQPLSGALLAIEQRQVVNEGWDRPKPETHRQAQELDPIWQEAPVVEENFNWSWYFAMHEVGDGAVRLKVREYFELLRIRSLWIKRASWFLPPVATQLMFERLAATDLESQLAYLEGVESAHQEMQERLLPGIFEEQTYSAEELLRFGSSLAPERFLARPTIPWPGLLQLSFLVILFGTLGGLRLAQVEKRL